MAPRTAALLILLAAGAAAQDEVARALAQLRSYPGAPAAAHGLAAARSLRVPLAAGGWLAVEVLLPQDLPAGERLPCLVQLTRTWRAQAQAPPGPEADLLCRHGYALVRADARGSGASPGAWAEPWSDGEVADGLELLAWAASQPWADGRLATFGTGYDATLAVLLAARAAGRVRAAVARFPVFDPWPEWLLPGGVPATPALREWAERQALLDRNRWPFPGAAEPPEVKPLDEDVSGTLLAEALAGRGDGVPVLPFLEGVLARGGAPAGPGLKACLPALGPQGPALLVQAGWLDGATAAAALHLLHDAGAPARVLLGPGLRPRPPARAEPFWREEEPPPLEPQGLWAEFLRFLDFHVKGLRNGLDPQRILFYRPLGAEEWRAALAWPPPGVVAQAFYLAEGKSLAREPPPPATLEWTVDFAAAAGGPSRWRPWAAETSAPARGRLVWVSPPLPAALEMAGTPELVVELALSGADGALHAWLEAVGPAGGEEPLTEAVLRLAGPSGVFRLAFLPVAALVPAGHRLQLALAGADPAAFARVPGAGACRWRLLLGGSDPARLLLPVAPAAASAPAREP